MIGRQQWACKMTKPQREREKKKENISLTLSSSPPVQHVASSLNLCRHRAIHWPLTTIRTINMLNYSIRSHNLVFRSRQRSCQCTNWAFSLSLHIFAAISLHVVCMSFFPFIFFKDPIWLLLLLWSRSTFFSSLVCVCVFLYRLNVLSICEY